MNYLFQPGRLGGLSLENRIVIAPMCQYSAQDGEMTDWHLIHLGHLALSGAGALTIEATAVSPEGRITNGDVGLYSDATEAAMRRVVESVRRYSPIPFLVQLAHAGRKASCRVPWDGGQQIAADKADGWRTVAPSALPFAPTDDAPDALDKAGLTRLRDAFVQAARRAHAVGIQGIEIHAAHGYLLHEFLSPLSNRRQDEYGGSTENRIRFPLEIFDAVRAAVPSSMPVGMRISATDWVDGGWDLDGSLVLAQALKAHGADFIHVSSGGLSPEQKIPLGPSYQTAFAARIKQETGLPTIAVGLITEAEQAESILATGQADFIALARAVLYDPRWPWHAAARLGQKARAPSQYLRSAPHQFSATLQANP